MPPSKANGFQRDTSMDYLLDPRYTIMEMERQDMAEYMQFKQKTGMDISFEQFRMLKYTPADSNSDTNSFIGILSFLFRKKKKINLSGSN